MMLQTSSESPIRTEGNLSQVFLQCCLTDLQITMRINRGLPASRSYSLGKNEVQNGHPTNSQDWQSAALPRHDFEIETVTELGSKPMGGASGERAYRFAWSQMPRVGPTLIPRLEQQFGRLAIAWSATAQELAQVPGFGPITLQEVLAARAQFNPAEAYEAHLQENPNFWTTEDGDYPLLLRELPSPPSMLYYRGQVELAENWGEKPAVAIVGTRHPSDYGLKWTRKLSRALAQQGFTVVSGLADGIDTAAHRACLEAGGRTIAVVGTGVDRVYPARNRKLCQQLVEQGLVVSEYPAGTHAHRSHFPQRNRIIAGLCRATIVVEAPKRSGALITAYAANEYCRDVYVVPGALDNPKVRGGLELIGQGAQVILDEHHLLDLLDTMPALDSVGVQSVVASSDQAGKAMAQSRGHAIALQGNLLTSTTSNATTLSPEREVPAATIPAPSNIPPELDPELAEVYAQVAGEALSFDGLVMRCQAGAGQVSSALLQLELLGLIEELPGKQYQRC